MGRISPAGMGSHVRWGNALAGTTTKLAKTACTFERLYHQEAHFVRRVMRRLGVPEADIEDVTQQLFLVVHNKLETFNGRSNIRTWLFGICLRIASDFRRRAYVRREVAHANPPCVGWVPGPEVEFDCDAAPAMIEQLLATLSRKQRAVFILAELEQMAVRNVAKKLGCPVQTAYSRLRIARQKLVEAARQLRSQE